MAESFSLPDETVKMLQPLKKKFGVNSNAEVISRALALAKVVADTANAENIVVVVGEGDPLKLNLAG